MLTRVQVSGFGPCRDVVLDDLGKVTALIGRNAAGKSHVLKAISTLAQFACSTGLDSRCWQAVPTYPSHPDANGRLRPLSYQAEVRLGDRSYRYAMTAHRVVDFRADDPVDAVHFQESLTYGGGPGPDRVVFRRTDEVVQLPPPGGPLSVGRGVSAMTALAALLPADDPSVTVTEPLRRFLAGVRYYPLDEPADASDPYVIRSKEYREWAARYQATGVLGASVPIQLLHLSRTQKERFEELKGNLGPQGLGLVDDISVDEFNLARQPGSEQIVYFVLFQASSPGDDGDQPFNFSQLSQGTRRVVRLLTAMAYGDAPVMLLEHPEDGVHKGLVRKVAGLFTTGATDGQVILATHSDTLVNQLDAESVRLVSMEDGVTSVRKLTPGELVGAVDYVNSDVGGTLAEFLHSVAD